MVEVGLVDRRSREAIFDMSVDVKLAQRQFHFLAGRIDNDQRPAIVVAAGHDGRFGCGDEFASPLQRLRCSRRRVDDYILVLVRSCSDLATRHNFRCTADSNLSLSNQNFGVLLAR